MKRAEGKTAIVTGGSVGIGRSACLLLAREGANVAVTDLQDGEGRQLVEEINQAGGSAEFWHLDVTSEAEVKEVFAPSESASSGSTCWSTTPGSRGQTSQRTSSPRRSGTR